MTLDEKVRKVGVDLDDDFLREGVALPARLPMDLQISEQIGAERYEEARPVCSSGAITALAARNVLRDQPALRRRGAALRGLWPEHRRAAMWLDNVPKGRLISLVMRQLW
jgi:hypothetical protein